MNTAQVFPYWITHGDQQGLVAPSSVSVTSSQRCLSGQMGEADVLHYTMKYWVCLVAQSYPTLCDPMDSSLPGFSVPGILQARTLEWVAISSSRASSWPREQTHVTCVSHSGILLSHEKNEITSFAATWIQWEIIIPSEETRKRKTNTVWYHLYVESKNMIEMNLFTKHKLTHRLWKQSHGYQKQNAEARGGLGAWDWGAHTIMCACMISCSSHVWLPVTLWTVARQAPLSMEFSRQEYWGGLPCSPPGDLPNQGIEPPTPASPALQVDSLPLSCQGSPHITIQKINNQQRILYSTRNSVHYSLIT